jgi:hypothetical protein
MKALEVLDKLVDVVLKYRPIKKKKRKIKRRKSKR